MSENTLRELRTIWTGETCEALDAHIKSVVASVMAEREPPKPEAEPIGSVRYYEQQLENLRQGIEALIQERDSAVAEVERLRPKNRPKVVCLCGSGRFMKAFEEAEFNETLAGNVVLTIGCNCHDVARTAELAHYKPMLDELHLRKIDMADEVFVQNVDGYIGESTRREIAYANSIGKPVRYLVGVAPPQPAAPPSPAPAATGEDELMFLVINAIRNSGCSIDGEADAVLAAIRPLFDAVRRERDEAKAANAGLRKCAEDAKHSAWELKQRAEAAESERDKLAAELAEVREAAKRFGHWWCVYGSDRCLYGMFFYENRARAYQREHHPAGDVRACDVSTTFRAAKGKEQVDA